jgi:predicted transcriptional regulator
MKSFGDQDENSNRILLHIKENPGCYLRQIKNDLHLSMGSIQYHLNKLESEGKITSQRSGLHKHYFPVGIFSDNEKEVIRFLTLETSREIIMFISEQGNPTQTDIVKKINISSPSINWHLKRLLNSKLIEETKDGKFKRYVLNSEIGSMYIGKLLKNYYPTIWDKWSDRLAEMFLNLSSIDDTKEKY